MFIFVWPFANPFPTSTRTRTNLRTDSLHHTNLITTLIKTSGRAFLRPPSICLAAAASTKHNQTSSNSRFCLHLHSLLTAPEHAHQRIYLYSSDEPDKKVNAALLMALYAVSLSLHLSPLQSIALGDGLACSAPMSRVQPQSERLTMTFC